MSYNAEEKAFAQNLQQSLPIQLPLGAAAEIKPFVPTAGLYAATWARGTPSHSWQSAAASGTSIGVKGLVVAAKTLSMTIYDLFINPQLIIDAKEEFLKRRGSPLLIKL